MPTTGFYNGTCLTLSGQPRAEALLAIDGRIAAVGSQEAVRAAAPADTEWVDLRGGALLPGFIDAHSHLTAVAATMGLLDLSGAASLEDLSGRIRDAACHMAPGAWVVGVGYDHNDLPGRRHPTRAELDAILPERPVLLSHASGHMGVANTAALEALGVTADVPDPEGGRIGREADGRTPSGYLEETAFTALAARMPQPTEAERMRNLEAAQGVYLAHGVTTVQDGLTRAPDWALLRAAAEAGRLQVDVVAYADMQNSAGLLAQAGPEGRAYHGRLRLGGYKLLLDGSPQGRTAWLTQPYLGQPESRGYPIYEDGQLLCYVRQAAEQRVQLLAHCNGDAAAEQFLRALEAVARDQPDLPRLRPVMIHAQLLRRDQLPRLAALGAVASFFVAHTYYWGDVHVDNLGLERAAAISPVRTALEAGVTYTLHQDAPVLPPDMLRTLACAVLRTTKGGRTLGPEERVSLQEALRGVTCNAAYQYFEEGDKGTLEVGKRADLVWLEQDPTRVAPQSLPGIRVAATFVEGRCLYRAGT